MALVVTAAAVLCGGSCWYDQRDVVGLQQRYVLFENKEAKEDAGGGFQGHERAKAV